MLQNLKKQNCCETNLFTCKLYILGALEVLSGGLMLLLGAFFWDFWPLNACVSYLNNSKYSNEYKYSTRG